MHLVKVLVEMPALALDQEFDYLSVKEIPPRVRVNILFNRRNVIGYVTKVEKTDLTKGELEARLGYRLSYIKNVIDESPLLNEELETIAFNLARQSFSSKIACIQTMLPKQLKPATVQAVGKKYQLYLSVSAKLPERLTKRQQEGYEFVRDKGKVKLTDFPYSKAIVDKLIALELLVKTREEIYREAMAVKLEGIPAPELNPDQAKIVKAIMLKKDTSFTALIHGVTGSGKTEVYLSLAAATIKSGRQVIMLVPEIALTPMMVKAFKNRFGDTVAVIHSRLSSGQRYDEYRRISNQEVDIVVGARSAIFAPLANVGLIVMDEEHDSSYKQDAKSPRYGTLNVAKMRSRFHGCPLVLGSATPSLESYARAKNGVYDLYELTNRINGRDLPHITMVDMKKELKNQNYSIFSQLLKDKIQATIAKGQQVILLLNKRGYAAAIQCLECGHVIKCPHCDVSLTYHKDQNKLKCHYCDYQVDFTGRCPDCHSPALKLTGEGTQKVAELIEAEFEGAKVLRFDVDSTRNKDGHQKILEQFENKEANILLGTQMIAKGLDFKDVTLVGVLNGDAALNLPDFRANERCFVLLEQVSGRAGRDSLEGEVIIQSYDIDHPVYKALLNHDYHQFFVQEMRIRKMANYPPFVHLASVLVTSKSEKNAATQSQLIANYLKKTSGLEVLGPAPSLIHRIEDHYRYWIMVKFKDSKVIYPCLQNVVAKYLNDRFVQVVVDFNPYNQI